ncbi:MAG: LysE family translocator [Rhodoblastus sp.]|nr:LysE family translocator [Rhodoblastus sp.]
MTLTFLLTSLIVVIAPGTGVIYTLATGLGKGARASVLAAFGCTLGILPHMAAAIFGAAALLHASALAFQTFKIVGVLYLLYMAWATLRETGVLDVSASPDIRVSSGIAIKGFLINILNPKLSVFFLAFLPQFVDARDPQALPLMIELSAAFMTMTFVVFVGYGLFAATIRDRIATRPRVMNWLRRTFAGAFLALGAKLAFAER